MDKSDTEWDGIVGLFLWLRKLMSFTWRLTWKLVVWRQ